MPVEPSNHADAATTPRVSIGVPVYNGARYLAEALDSLLAQTITDRELIISDTASTDDTASICEAYARRDARVRYFRQPVNIGAPRNWNFVAEQARAPFFKWATANDWCPPHMLEQCLAGFEADPSAVLVQGTTCLVDEISGRREPYTRDLALPMKQPSARLAALYQDLALNNGQSGLIRVDALRRTRLDRPYEGGDFALMAELALQGRFVVLPDMLLYRRMGPATFSRSLGGEAARQFYDPTSEHPRAGERLRLHLDLLRSVATARIELGERMKSLALALRHAVWDRAAIWAEFKPKSKSR